MKSQKNNISVIGVIPARYASTRLPGKLLLMISGKTMIQRVYGQAMKSKLCNEVLVATDDKRIYDIVMGFGGNAVMTSAKHKSGTDRIGEAVRNIKADIVVNIQGDEPFIDPNNIDKAVGPLISDKSINMSTLAIRINDKKEVSDPNVVKVVFDTSYDAMYFSRNPIPYDRDKSPKTAYFKHIGLYVYRKSYLMKLIKMKPSKLEIAEKLEQLRVLESGGKIRVVLTNKDSHSVDTKNDLKRMRVQARN